MRAEGDLVRVTPKRILRHTSYVGFALLLLLIGTPVLYAQNDRSGEDPAAGVAWSLWHPSSLGVPLAGQYRVSDPLAVLSFPHLHALASESRVAVSGGGVIGTGTSGGALGLIVPTRRVIWNGAVSILGDDTGFHGRGVLALARPLGSRLQGGAGASISIAEGDDQVTAGAGIDLGLRYDLGVFRDLSRVDLHLALLNVGASASRGDYDPLVPAFTPVAGLRTRVLENESLTIDVGGAVRVPGFSGFGFEAGAALVLERGPVLQFGWRGAVGREDGGVWPGVSLGIRIPTGQNGGGYAPSAYGALQLDRSGNSLLAAEAATGFETTDQEPPTVTATLVTPETDMAGRLPTYIELSPQGYNAQVEIDVGAVDNRSIQQIRSRLLDEQGREVRVWRHAPVGSSVPVGTITERLVSDLWQRKITGTLYWDVYDSVPDGLYRLEITASDRAGNVASVPPMEIRVDGRPPFMEATVVPVDVEGNRTGEAVIVSPADPIPEEEMRIAPDSDVQFTLEFRDAERLTLEVVDQAGRTVVPLSAQPKTDGDRQVLSLTWPGTERDGTRIQEGIYRIKADAIDARGNRSAVVSPPLLIQSIQPRFSVAVSDTIVAPTGDGNRDTVTVTPRLEPITGLQEWSLELLDDRGVVVSRWGGIDLPPQAIVLGRDSFPADGEYSIVAVSRYRNGAVSGDRAGPIVVDTRAPEVDLILGRARVQPDIDPVVPVFLETDRQAVQTRLLATQVDSEPRLIREWSRVPERYDWQLLLADGTFPGPGTYELFLEAWDEAGNRSASPRRRVTLLERLEGVGVVPERSVFGPTGNGRFDTLQISLDGAAFTAASGTFQVDIRRDGEQETVRRFSGTLPLPPAVVWDGRNNQGIPVADGNFRAFVSVTVPDRGTVSAQSTRFAVDTRPPSVVLEATPSIVSPDGDGRQDELLIRPVFRDEGDARYRVFLGDEEILARTPTPEAGAVAWEPRLADGTVLPDGDYSLVLEVEDDAGNIGRSEQVQFTVDTRPVSGFVRIGAAAFAPGSAERPNVTFTPVLPVTRGLDRWQFRVVPEDGDDAVLLRQGGDDVGPSAIEWNGRVQETGATVEDGLYSGVLTARYRHGPVVEVRSPPVRVDATPPEVDVVVTPQPFSPDGDGVDDTVDFLLDVHDESPIRYWILEIYDPTGEFFYDIGGRGEPPRRVRWDGRARTGELVVSAEEYPWRLEIADDLGNTTIREGSLLVDVLVERFGEGYRIQLPSITFPPNSAVLNLDPDNETGLRNRTILNRLVEILRRFPDYQIVIEGHAVNLSGTEREHRDELIPLSRERAAAVRSALIESGVPARLLSVEGRGGAAPIVPHTDEVNRWKNRRVDFLLKR